MAKYTKLFSLALVLAALFVFFTTGSVFADDGSTPPPAAEETALPAPAAEEAAAPVTLEEAPPAGETPPAAEELEAALPEEGEPAPAPLPEEGAVEPPVEPGLEEAPAEPVTLVDESGAPLTLATEETAELLKSGDPYITIGTTRYAWVTNYPGGCPASTATYFVVCNPTTATTAITDVLAFINTGMVPTDKKIYVENGIYTQNVLIDGTTSAYHKLLTGLIGVDGSAVTTLNGDVKVQGVTGGFTLSGFTINGSTGLDDPENDPAVWMVNNTGTLTLTDLVVKDSASDGIVISNQAGAVTLTDVGSSDNDGRGADIDNTRGIFAVTVTNAAFDDNSHAGDGSGLNVNSKGAVTVNGISASRNKGQGAAITSAGTVSVKNSVLADNSEEGLYVLHAAATTVTLENLVAEANGKPENNAGIAIYTQGPVSAAQLTVRWNGRSGMYLSEANGIYPTTVSVSESSFYENNWAGLYLEARGNVTLTDVNANSNHGGDGVYIDNALYYDGTPSDGINNPTLHGTGTVTLLNTTLATTAFNNNAGDGLEINSGGAVTITGYRASRNGGDGFRIKNNYTGKLGGVTINALALVESSMAQSYFNDNGNNGVSIVSNGAVAINGNPTWTMRFDRNGNLGICIGGICIDDLQSANLPSAVTLKGVDMENNANGGLSAHSKGAITLTNVWVNNPWGNHMFSDGDGILLNNIAGSGGVTLTDVAASYVDGYGIYIDSKGAVALTRVSTYRTHLNGIYINNIDGIGTVTLTDVDVQQAHARAIEISSKGKVTLSGVNVENTAGDSLDVGSEILTGQAYRQTWFNFFANLHDNVTISVDFDGDGWIGLYDATSGEELDHADRWDSSDPLVVSAVNLGFHENDPLDPDDDWKYDGEYLLFFDIYSDWQDDFTYTLTFTYNTDDTYVNTTVFPRDAIYINNSLGTADVSISGSTNNPWPWVSNNSGSGIDVSSRGAVTVKNINLHRDGGNALAINNNAALTPKTVTVENIDIYRAGSDGMVINSIGAVAMKNIYSRYNGGSGLVVDNCFYDGSTRCRGNAPVSLLATGSTDNNFSDNNSYGVSIKTIGLVTINNFAADDNLWSGLYINAPDPGAFGALYRPTGGGVTLVPVGNYWNHVSRTYGNGSNGVYIKTYGPVILTRLGVDSSIYAGIYIDNKVAFSAKPVTLTNVDANENNGNGLEIYSKGTVTLNGVASSHNYTHNQQPAFNELTRGINLGNMYTGFELTAGTELAVYFGSDLFEGSMALYDEFYNQLENAWTDYQGDTMLIDYTIPSDGWYTLEIYQNNWRPYGYEIAIFDSFGGAPAPTTGEDYSNTYDGVYIETGGDVSITAPAGSERWWYNNNSGAAIQVYAGGSVKVTDADLNSNYKQGLYVYGSGAGKTTTLANLRVYENGNDRSHEPGVEVRVRGPVTMTSLYVGNNKGDGVNVDNCASDGSKCLGSGAITLNGGDNHIHDNHYYSGSRDQGVGLNITTIGLVTLSNFTVENHPDGGVKIYAPTYTPKPAPMGGVTITSSGGYTNEIRNNWGGRGLYITTYGTVSLSSLNVHDNGGENIYVSNIDTSGAPTVTLTNVHAWSSRGNGISIFSRGNVTLNGVAVDSAFDRNNWVNLGDTIASDSNKAFGLWSVHFHFDASAGDEIDLEFNAEDFAGEMVLSNPYGNQWGDSTDSTDLPLSLYHAVEGWEEGQFNVDIYSWTDAPFYYTLSISADPSYGYGGTTIYPGQYNGIVLNNELNNGTGNVTLAKTSATPNPGVWGVSGIGLFVSTNGALGISDFTSWSTGQDGIYATLSTNGKTASLARVTSERANGFGVYLGTKGPVTVTDLSVKETRSDGLRIYNLNGAPNSTVTVTRATIGNTGNTGLWVWANGAVTLTDVKTWYNAYYGLKVDAKGAITLTRVDTRFNREYGADLTNYEVPDSLLVKPGVTITDSTFNNNNYGLWIKSKGAAALLGVNVEGNYWHGRQVSEDEIITGGTITSYIGGLDYDHDNYLNFDPIGRVAEFPFTWSGGLLPDVTLTPYGFQLRIMLLTAAGEQLTPSYYSWDPSLLSGFDLPAGDYIIRVRAMTWNDGGTHFWADPAWYTLSFNGNPGELYAGETYGARVINHGALTVDKSAARGSSEFNGNGGTGLDANISAGVSGPGGNVVIARTNIRRNQGDGLWLNLHAGGKTTTFTNLFLEENEGFNAWVTTYGPFTWTGGTSNRSHAGVGINNQDYNTYLPHALTISNVDFFETWDGSGLTVNSYGNVTLTSVGAWNNNGYGIYIDNCGYDGGCRGIGTVAVNNSNGSSIDGNYNGTGLNITSGGAVTLTNIRSAWNSDNGISVNNKNPKASGGFTSGGVTIVYTQERSVDNNGSYGIEVLSNGAIKLTTNNRLYFSNNGAMGIRLHNDASPLTTPPAVNVEGVLNIATGKYGYVSVDNNHHRGIEIYSKGVVTVKYTGATGNWNTGLYIGYPYDQSRKPGSVVLTNVISQSNGCNGCSDSEGVVVNGNGTVTVTNVDANQNWGHGMYIETKGAVSVKKSLFNYSGTGDPADGYWGLWISTPKDVTLDGITVNGNDNGLYVDTMSGTGKVSLLGTSGKNIFIGNHEALRINSYGSLVMNRLDLKENRGDMYASSSTGSATLNTVNILNNVYGLQIEALTGATFVKVVGLNNGIRYDDTETPWDDRTNADGIYVGLTSPTATASFTDCAFTGNTGNGIEVSYYSGSTPAVKPGLLRTTYFGNDSDFSGDANLYYHN